MFIECKELAANKRYQQCQQENYLGKFMFEHDLHRSFDQFMKIAVCFCPYRFDDGCPALSPV
jgi:hypothetical protein